MSTQLKRPDDEKSSENKSGVETATSAEKSSPTDAITLGTILDFLSGEESAIKMIAGSSSATWLGLAFVICAGFFREYDQEDLLLRPWYVLIPLITSLVLASVLWSYREYITGEPSSTDHPNKTFRGFLNCFWMCAPMAVIYAIPVEHMTAAIAATKWNLIFLCIVSIWRVTLISRVLSVLFHVRFLDAFLGVVILADMLLIAIMALLPIPTLQIMGGIQLSEAERVMASFRINVFLFAILSLPIWLIAKSMTGRDGSQAHGISSRGQPHSLINSPVSISAWLSVIASAAVILIGCSIMQPERQRESRIASLIRNEMYIEASEYVATLSVEDFPPFWEPPPLVSYSHGDRREGTFALLRAAQKVQDVPDWYLDRIGPKLIQMRHVLLGQEPYWEPINSDQIDTLAWFLSRRPHWSEKLEEKNGTTICEFVESRLSGVVPTSFDGTEHEDRPASTESLRMILESLPESRECRAELIKRIDHPEEFVPTEIKFANQAT